MITVPEVLCHFSAVTNAPSTMGGQLDQLAAQSEAKAHGAGWRTHSKPTPPKRQDPENNILRSAELYRLVAELGRIRSVELSSAEMLVKVAYDRKESVGRIVVRTLRSYQSALAAPSDEDMARATERAAKTSDSAKRAAVFQKAIGEYRAPRGLAAVQAENSLKTTAEAAQLYGDCLLVLGLFVQRFNRKGKTS